MFKLTEHVQVGGKWMARDRVIKPKNGRLAVLMKPPEKMTKGGLHVPDQAVIPTEEGEVIEVCEGSKYQVGQLVVLPGTGGIKHVDPSRGNALIRTVPEEQVIHVFTEVTRECTAEELAKLTAEDVAVESLAAQRAEFVAQLNVAVADI